MKEKIKLFILIIVFVALLFLVNFLLDGKQDLSNNVQNETVQTGNATTEIIDEYIPEESNDEEKVYVEVTEANFEKEVLKSDKKVLVDFYADWCNPCKILSPVLEEVARENPDIKLVKIDVDTNENLAYDYRAFSIPTLVVIENGKEVNRAVGAIPKEDVLELLK